MAETMLYVAMAATVAGGLTAAAGQARQAEAANEAAQFKAQVAENNAKTLENNAVYAQRAGRIAAINQGMRARQHQGAVKASQAAAGLDINSGSNVDVQAGEAMAGRQDVLTEEANAQLRAYGYRTQAANERAQAQLDRMEGKNAITAGKFASASTLLGTVGKVGYNWPS